MPGPARSPVARPIAPRRSDLRALTGMRGIAAWAVVAYHVRTSAGLPAGIERVVAKGYLAVDFFFLLSGFVIWMSWAERLGAGVPGTTALFLRRRVARIWPLHLAMLGFAVMLAGLIAATGRPLPAGFVVADLPMHALLLQDWGLVDPLAWNDPAWSISAELAAYLLFPTLARTVSWRRMPVAATVVAIAALIGLLHLIFRVNDAVTLGADIRHLGVVRCVLEFTVGGAVCSLWQRAARREGAAAILSTTVLATVGAATWAGALPETLGVPAAFTAGLLLLAVTSGWRASPLGWRPIHWLGEISYATYLSHFLLWFAVKLALVDGRGQAPLAVLIGYAATLLLVSAVLYHGLEKPAQRAINRRSADRAVPACTRATI